MAVKLSALQHEFLKQLFSVAQGNMPTAAKAVGLDDYGILLDDAMVEAIKTRADKELAGNIPRAVYVINKMLEDDGSGMFVSDKLHKVATDILDRAGLSKQERPQTGSQQMGLIFLPNKIPLPEPPKQLESEMVPDGIPSPAIS